MPGNSKDFPEEALRPLKERWGILHLESAFNLPGF
jgi:hypothetical protein